MMDILKNPNTRIRFSNPNRTRYRIGTSTILPECESDIGFRDLVPDRLQFLEDVGVECLGVVLDGKLYSLEECPLEVEEEPESEPEPEVEEEPAPEPEVETEPEVEEEPVEEPQEEEDVEEDEDVDDFFAVEEEKPTESDFDGMLKDELIELCEEHSLDTDGLKADLIERLIENGVLP